MPYPVLQFEKEADPDGEWITMAVRMKLDLAGLKIRLPDWTALAPEERTTLHDMPAESDEQVAAFCEFLHAALARAGRPEAVALPPEQAAGAASWKQPGPPPPEVGRTLAAAANAWRRLDRFGRYVVCHLAAKSDDGRMRSALAELSD